MPPSPTPALLLLSHIYLLGAAFIFFLFIYNFVVCALDRSLLKTTIRNLDLLLFLTIVAGIVLRFDTPLVQEILSFSPQAPAAWLALSLAGFIWAAALACQTLFTYRLFRPAPVPYFAGKKVKRSPFVPKIQDWKTHADPDYGRPTHPTKPGAPPPPKPQRRLTKLKGLTLQTRLMLLPFFHKINQVYDLEITQITLQFPTLPSAFDGLRVLQLSDPHYGQDLSPLYYQHVMSQARALDPDLILITGDFTGHDNLYREAVEIFSPLKAPMGLWAILGNHDYFTEPELITYWLEHDDIRLLDNRSFDFERTTPEGQTQTLRLIGTGHPHKPVDDWAALAGPQKDHLFRLVMSHRPDYTRPLAQAGADFILSGHTHGGQWRLPLIGPLIVPSRLGRRYVRGLFQTNQTVHYTTSGLGVHTIPLRLHCRPEITLFELKSAPLPTSRSQS